MTVRTLTLILASIVLLLAVSWTARTYLARQRCESFGKLHVPGKGCVEPDIPPPVIIERGLKRA